MDFYIDPAILQRAHRAMKKSHRPLPEPRYGFGNHENHAHQLPATRDAHLSAADAKRDRKRAARLADPRIAEAAPLDPVES